MERCFSLEIFRKNKTRLRSTFRGIPFCSFSQLSEYHYYFCHHSSIMLLDEYEVCGSIVLFHLAGNSHRLLCGQMVHALVPFRCLSVGKLYCSIWRKKHNRFCIQMERAVSIRHSHIHPVFLLFTLLLTASGVFIVLISASQFRTSFRFASLSSPV